MTTENDLQQASWPSPQVTTCVFVSIIGIKWTVVWKSLLQMQLHVRRSGSVQNVIIFYGTWSLAKLLLNWPVLH